jgi:hypothetical protein
VTCRFRTISLLLLPKILYLNPTAIIYQGREISTLFLPEYVISKPEARTEVGTSKEEF